MQTETGNTFHRQFLVMAVGVIALTCLAKAQDALQVVDLPIDASPTEILEAKKAYQQGQIVRVVGGSPADLRRLIESNAYDVRPPATSKDGRRLTASEIASQVSAIHRGKYGELHQFTGMLASDAKDSQKAEWERGFEAWRDKERGALGDPSAPPQVWTQVLSVTDVQSGDWGSTQTIMQVFRLNDSDTSADYYMVLTDPTISPNFKVPASNCASIFLTDCGWYTAQRVISMSTTPAGVLFDHGPSTPVSTDSGSWTLGLSLPAALGATFSQNWSQASVTTNDQSNVTTGSAQWTETFVQESAFKQLPATSTSPFLSHQGAIFKLPPGGGFQLAVNVTPTTVYQPSFGNPSNGGGSFYFNGAISPPQFSINPGEITIAPGSSGNIQVIARIGDDTLGLPWNVSNIPSWLTVDQITGARTTLLKLTVAPGTALGTSGSLNFDTSSAFAAPSVVNGPIKMSVQVGQPNLHGALLIGGAQLLNSTDSPLGTALLYAADTNQFAGISRMAQARAYHTSTLLADGTILVAGGISGNRSTDALATAELYDPIAGTFTPLSQANTCPGGTGCMTIAGSARVATRLANGKVLFTGGIDSGENAIQTAEVYDPATRTFTAAGNMTSARWEHTATLLPTGEVLVAGGANDISPTVLNTTAELYNPTTNSFRTTTGAPAVLTYQGNATLTGGAVLLTGGGGNDASAGLSAQLYSPASGTFAAINNMNASRNGHTTTLLQDGRVLLTGGVPLYNGSATENLATAEIYDPNTRTFTLLSGTGQCPGAPGCMQARRALHTDTLLLDGRVFLSGGVDGTFSTALNTTELFDPATNTFTAGPTFDGRVSHTAAFLHASSVTGIQSSVNPSAVGQQVTFTATVTVSNPKMLSGTITFYDGTSVLGTAPLTNSSAALTVSLQAGQHGVSATYAGNDSYGPSSSAPLVQQVNVTPTTMTLSSNLNPSQFGNSVTFTATIAAQGSNAPTGTVRFLDNGTLIGSVPATQRTVQLTLGTLSAGAHPISAAYSGDVNYGPDTSNTITQTVNGLGSQTTLTSSANPVGFGAPVTFTAKVVSAQGSGATPTGRVVFADAGNPINSADLVDGTAMFTTSTLTQGAHQITAAFSGDGTYAASTSTALTETVGAVPTTASMTPVKNPVVYGQDTVSFTVTVTAPGPNKPTGTVTLLEGTTTLTSGLLDPNGQVILSYPQGLNSGSHLIVATYAGTTSFGTSTSQGVNLTVDQAPTTTSLAITPAGPTSYGQTLTFTATIQGPGNRPSGTVTFLDGTRTVGTGPVISGSAVFQVATLSGGAHSFSAIYGGDSNYATSQGSVVDRTITAAQSTVALTSSANPASVGQTVNLGIAVTSPTGVPTGKVAVINGTIQVALLDLNSGNASYTLQNFKPGTYNLTAAYQGDGNFAAATSNAVPQVISGLTATLQLSSSQNPSQAKANLTFAATINGSGSVAPTGTLIFYDGTAIIGTSPITQAQGSYVTNALSVGGHQVTVKWAGDDNYQAVTSNPVNQVVNPATTTTTTTVGSNKNPASVGELVTFQAQVQASSSNGNNPTGTVTFMDGSASLGSAPLTGGSASLNTSTLTPGSHSITAVYNGDTNFSSSTSAAIAQIVNAMAATTVTLASQPSPSLVNQPVLLQATVQAGTGTPTGSVTFLDGAATLGSAPLTNGAASLSVPNLSQGTHTITAVYRGDSSHSGATSNVVQQQVNRSASSVALSADINPSMTNQTVTFTAAVTSTAGTPTGTVTFQDGTTVFGTVQLNRGLAILSTSALSAGSHNLTATYGGNGDVQASTSHILTHIVNGVFPAVATITSATPNPAIAGQPVTFTVTVTSTGGGTPAGSVTLSEGAAIYGFAPLVNGSAQIPVNTLAKGGHVIAATYGGDSTHTGATSATVQVQID